jgi:hypothetical protein
VLSSDSGDGTVGAANQDIPAIQFALFAIPGDTYVRIATNASIDARISISDLLGREMMVVQPNAGAVDVSALPDGLYVVRLQDRNSASTHVIMVKH